MTDKDYKVGDGEEGERGRLQLFHCGVVSLTMGVI